MGFFDELRHDLSQAVNELLPSEEVKEEEVVKAPDVEEPEDFFAKSQSVVSALAEEAPAEEVVESPSEVVAEDIVPEDLDALLANLEVPEMTEAVLETSEEMTVEIPETVVEIPEMTVEIPETSVELPEMTVEIPETSVELPEMTEEILEEAVEASEIPAEILDMADSLPELAVELPSENIVDNIIEETAVDAATVEELLTDPVLDIDLQNMLQEPTSAQDATENAELDTLLDEALLANQLVEEPAEPAEPAEAESVTVDLMTEEIPVQVETSVENKKENENKGVVFTMEPIAERELVDETSVITKGMNIKGDLTAEGSLDLIGSVNGNIEVGGKLNITGVINGNSKAYEIFAESAKISGDVTSATSVKIGAGTVIIGNIVANSAAIAGAVKGDIDVHGPVILDSSAIVMGNIRSKSVQINNGAAIEGNCSQCYADVSPTSFFDEYK